MTPQKRALLFDNTFMLILGLTSIMIGTTLPEIIREFDLTLTRGGLLVSVQNLGGLLAMLAGMAIADRLSKPAWILISVAGSGVLYGAIGASPAFVMLAAAFFLSGITLRALDVLLNAFTGDIFPVGRVQAMNLLHMFYSIGALAGPVFARWLIEVGLQWDAVYWIAGGVFLAAAGVSLFWRREYLQLGRAGALAADDPGPEPGAPARDAAVPAERDPAEPKVPPPGNWTTLPDDRAAERDSRRGWLSIAVLGLILLFYAVHQLGTTAWLPLFLQTEHGIRPALASAALSFYWVGVIVSRFATSVIGARVGEARILLFGTLAGGLVLCVSVLTKSAAAAIVGFAAAGVATGATLPVAMSIAHARLPLRTGAVSSILYGMLAIGRLTGPWTIGAVGDRLGIGVGIMIAAAVLLPASLLSIWIAADSRRGLRRI